MATTIHEILKSHWGFDSFRSKQQDIIESVIAGKDTLALLPTGGGKSVCFQIPGLYLGGCTIVVSPLIALMKDQVRQLKKRGIIAECLVSGMSKTAIDQALDNCIYGNTKFLYVSPERLKTELFLARLPSIKCNLIAVDEAHCISQWGYDFRPDYLEVASIREYLPKVPIIALTATATPTVADDIQDKLAFKSPNLIQKSFERSNLAYIIKQEEDKFYRLERLIQKTGGSGILYVQNRRKTEEYAQLLINREVSALAYHAGLDSFQRSEAQEKWINNEVQVIVATNAFGMGIDKADVRMVVHWTMPKDLEGYYQETGRAGRDGEESEAVLFYKSADFSLLAGFFDDETEDQKNLLLNKLRRMGDFADAYTCRRKILLQYFNETRASNACGKCDNCDTPQRTWDGTETAQKLFSTLARLQYDYGLAHSVSILRGSKAKKITPAQQQLSTYGIGKEHSQSAWMDIGKQLIQLGFIEQSIGQYPVIRLNDRSWQVLRGHERVELVQFEARPDAPADASSRSRSTRGSQTTSESGTASAAIKGTPLFEKLRTKRLEIAQNLGVPAFVIVSDKTLVALCEGLPTDPSSLLQVHGFGKVKAKRFGNDFLDVIHSHSVASEA